MYKIEWIKDKNIPKLNDFAKDTIIPPRPVYYEELDLLGFNKYWDYPNSIEPLLWALGREYYYNGEKIGKAVGGDINNAPKLEIYHNNIELIPINLEELIYENKEKIEILKNESLDFIKKIYKDYKDKVNFFIVAFSGGKDSQVILDLITIALEPKQYKVIFTDTTMELPQTYGTVRQTENYYKKTYTDFKITTVRNPTDANELWNVFGPPSRILRWCCSVYKTSPVHSYLKSLNDGKHPRTILYDGVRRDESHNRLNHLRVADSVKHHNVINTRPIIEWNDFEVYLYMFYSGVKINNEYRIGLNRVGCNICPFASQWSDYIINKQYPDLAKKFISTIDNYMENSNIENTKEYLEQGHWKKRAGGNSVETKNKIDIQNNKNKLEVNLQDSKEDIFEWLKVLGNYKVDNNGTNINIDIGKKMLNIGYNKQTNSETIVAHDDDIINIGHLKKVAYKTSYCVHCGSCEAECPTGALNVFPTVQVDTNLCIHCSKCLDFHNKGCVMADSAHISVVGTNNNSGTVKGFNDYGDFGLRREWLNTFLNKGLPWIIDNELGTKQKISLKKWLRDAELLDEKAKNVAPLSALLQSKNDIIRYQLIYINLYFNSSLLNWFVNDIERNKKYSSHELSIIAKEYTQLAETTVKHSINSLVNLFDSSPLGNELKIGYITKEKNIRFVEKIGTNDVSNIAILFLLYKLKESLNRTDFRVSEFYNDNFIGGPYKLFGIDKDIFTSKLRFIAENTKLIDVDLNQGLDNIFLKDLNYKEVLAEVINNEME
jgi:phosphoadenosine phosphosulfate reductase